MPESAARGDEGKLGRRFTKCSPPNPESAGGGRNQRPSSEWSAKQREAIDDMLMNVYVAGSTSSQRVAARPRMLENMSLDFQALQIDVRRLTE